MSDKIKQNYVSYMNGENPSEEFLSSLTERLKAEEKRVREKKRNSAKIRVISIAAAGIAACAAVPIALSLTKAPVSHLEKPLDNLAGTVNSSVIITKPLDTLGDFSEITAKELANLMIENLSELLVSETNNFVNAANADGEKCRELIEKLSSAEETSQTPAGKQSCYMAVFENGAIVKFKVYENGVITINSSEKRFV